jgi:hypothetical protein
MNDDLRAFRDTALSDGLADTGDTACDEDDFVVETHEMMMIRRSVYFWPRQSVCEMRRTLIENGKSQPFKRS